MMNIVFVGLGGFIGASTRYLISLYASKLFTSKIPIGTLTVCLLYTSKKSPRFNDGPSKWKYRCYSNW